MSISSRQVIRVLEKHGFVLKRIKGSHHHYISGGILVSVPHPKKDLPSGTLNSIIERSRIPKEEFLK